MYKRQAKLYGEFSIVRSTTLLFADFVGLSIGAAGTNYIAKYYQNDNVKVGKLVGVFNVFSFTFGFLLFILSWLSLIHIFVTCNEHYAVKE